METGVHREIGRHDAQIEALQAQLAMHHDDMKRMNVTISAIQATLSEARGGWRTLMYIGGASAAAGAVAAKLFSWLMALPR